MLLRTACQWRVKSSARAKLVKLEAISSCESERGENCDDRLAEGAKALCCVERQTDGLPVLIVGEKVASRGRAEHIFVAGEDPLSTQKEENLKTFPEETIRKVKLDCEPLKIWRRFAGTCLFQRSLTVIRILSITTSEM